MAWLGQEGKLTWEPSSSLPKKLIDEFHKGLSFNELVNTSRSFGAINHTLVMASEGVQPKAKKLKQEGNTAMFNSG